tara:strand:+ start:906 stop:1208 length:303 start_codon:yes stop_codon:yes gene_type:complete
MPVPFDHPEFVAVVLAWHAGVSLVSFAAYGLDKHRAARERWRTPERALHTLGLLGGWPGGLLAMRLFKHKRRKAAFVRVFWLTVAGHLAVVGAAVWLLTR